MQSRLFQKQITGGLNLRVLVYMNPLVVDKIAKKFLYEKDSGFLYTRQLIEKLPPNWRYYILVPKGVKRGFFPKTHNIVLVPYDYSTSIHQNRYHFNRNILAGTFPYGTDVDVVLNNQPEVTANLYMFLQVQRREKPIIINYYHWIDCRESTKYGTNLTGYIWRQMDGALIGNPLNMFHCEHAKKTFDESCEEQIGKKLECRYEFFHPEATKFGEKPVDLPKNKIILFNHRLNNSTGWKEVVETCNEVYEAGNDFTLWLTDDKIHREQEYLSRFPFIKQKRLSFENYGYLIKNSHFAVCSTQGYVTWNMAVLDCVLNGCLPIVPDIEVYHDLFKKGGCYWSDLKHSILTYLNNPKWLNDELLNKIELPKDDFDLKAFIVKEIYNRIEGKTPAKYDEVTDFIKRNKKGLKKDFVNKFWGFHANSNFQKIRWKLLTEGFIDDTSKHETVYYDS